MDESEYRNISIRIMIEPRIASRIKHNYPKTWDLYLEAEKKYGPIDAKELFKETT